MIYDVLENLTQYTGLFENLDTALEYLSEADLDALPLGRTDIDGDRVYLTVSQCQARPSEEALFEVHSAYMDIHIDLEGVELFETALGPLQRHTPYDPVTDTALYTADLSAACVLGPGRFLVAMTEEPHKPAVKSAAGSALKKLVVKVRREDGETGETEETEDELA